MHVESNHEQGTHLVTSDQTLLKAVFEHAPNAILLIDDKGQHIEANPAASELTGYSKAELMKKRGWELRLASTQAIGKKQWRDFLGEGRQNGKFELMTKDGSIVSVEYSAVANITPGTHLTVLYNMSNCSDETLEMSRGQIQSPDNRQESTTTADLDSKVEEALRKSKARYQELFDTITSGVAVYEAVEDGQDFVFLEFNPAGEKIEGISAQELLGKRVSEVFPGISESGILAAFQRVWRTGQSEYNEEVIYQDDRHEKTWREHSTYKLPSGEIVAVYNDITERKRIEEALRENEQRYRYMFENHKAIMLLIDPNSGNIIEANQAACDYYGYSQEELAAMKISDINTLPEQAVKEEMTRARQEERSYFLFRHRLASGEVHDVEVRSGPINFQDQTLLYSIIHDITERKRAEEIVARGREFLAAVLDTMPVGVCLTDEAGHYQMMNKIYAQTFEHNREEMLGQHYTVVLPPDQVESANKYYKQIISGEDVNIPLERRRQRKDGSVIYVAAANALVTGVDGQKMVITTVRDITARKQAEAEREQLIADLEAYAHTVAHDLKNPIGIILGFANLLHEDKEMSQEQVDESLNHIMQVSEKMISIIDELLLLSSVRQIKEIKPTPLDMVYIVENSLSRHYFMIAQNQVEITLPENNTWPVALGHEAWVEEIWSNYISNAIKYGGTPPKLELGATVQDDGMVRFWLRDNGPGIDPEKQGQLFDEFTRFDELRADGHGLGLSIVRRIIDKLGGEAGVESEGLPEKGSTFFFTLPSNPDK